MAYSLKTSVTWAATINALEETFNKWGIVDWEVLPRRVDSRKSWWMPAERVVEIRFKRRGQADYQVFKMGKQERPVDNLRALYLGLESMRMNEVRGIGELVREMYAALPAPKRERDPFEVLGIRPDAPKAIAEASYRELAKTAHPDSGGSNEAMAELNKAIEAVRAR